jgi:iron-containing alcohol dehydrogenase-like protein
LTEREGLREGSEAAQRARNRWAARTVAIVYEPELTRDLPARESAGTAMNALGHCAEALYTTGRAEETDAEALAGARLISRWLPVVVDNGHDLEARRGLLEGAMHAGAALRARVGLGHGIAQALGGRYGLPHGTMNAVSLPAALRFNSIAAAGELARFGEAIDREGRRRTGQRARGAGGSLKAVRLRGAQGGPARAGAGDRGAPTGEGEPTPGAAGRSPRAAGRGVVIRPVLMELIELIDRSVFAPVSHRAEPHTQ